MRETFDFMALGQAIKKAREAREMTREQLAEILDIAPRQIQSIVTFGDKELTIIEGTAKAICKAKEPEE